MIVADRARPDAGLMRIARLCSHYMLRGWQSFLLVFAAMLLNIGVSLLKPWPLKVLVDGVFHGQRSSGLLGWLQGWLPGAAGRDGLLTWTAIATIAVFLLGWATELARSCADISFGQRVTYDVAADVFAHLQKLSPRFHGKRMLGDSVRRVTSDSGCVASILDGTVLPIVYALITLAGIFGIMWALDRTLVLLALLAVPFMALITRVFAGPMLERSSRQQEQEAQQYVVVEQTLSALPAIKAFTGEGRADQRMRATTREIIAATMASTNVDLQFRVLLGLVTAVGTAVVIWVGAHHVMEGRLTVGSLLVFLTYLATLYDPVHTLAYVATTTQTSGGSVRRVLDVLDTPPDVRNQSGARDIGRVRGGVRLEAVIFGYEPGRPVVREITLEAQPGETIAIVGETGAGKSTLVSLIPRFFDPWSGRVLIDGQDIRDLRIERVREQIALVLQDAYLFPLSIAENIAYGKPGAGQQEIEAAAKAANAHTFITALPDGYATVIGERGATLSGGERQRLAIARALVKDAPILVLDEPTSALDAETEAALMDAIERLMAGRTTFIIAHRLSTIRQADRIAVLEEGRLVEYGRHAELLRRNGRYARFYHLQYDATPDAAGV